MDSSFNNFFKKRNKNKETEVGKANDLTGEHDPEKEINLKIVFLGETATGAKSCFVHYYIKNAFNDRLESTIGACFSMKGIDVRGKKVKLELWDTAGQERFTSLEPMYYRGAAGIVLGYDITSRETLETLRRRYVGLKKRCPDAVMMVIGNKVDLVSEHWGRAVPYEEGDELANEVGASLFFETSAKTGFNVNESMSALVEEILITRGILDEME